MPRAVVTACVLLEQSDFGKGTSSRSTKLVHGGVRYLQQGNVSLVMEALKERGILFQNAPHLVHDLPFVVPNYQWWETPFYGIGLKVYDLLAGKYGFGKSVLLSRRRGARSAFRHSNRKRPARRRACTTTASSTTAGCSSLWRRRRPSSGACLAELCAGAALSKNGDGMITGLSFATRETGRTYAVSRRGASINATGAFSRRAATSGRSRRAEPMIAPSQGVHIVLDRSFLPGDTAIMVPHTRDGRVMFAIPWHGHVVVGHDRYADHGGQPRTHTRWKAKSISSWRRRAVTWPSARARTDILSVFTGIRPLVNTARSSSTAALSREHTITISKSGLLTIAGGKWTTYRKMAEDCLDHAIVLAGLEERPCVTQHLAIHGATSGSGLGEPLSVYGTDAADRSTGQRRRRTSHPLASRSSFHGAQVVWAVRQELARTVDDVLSRRTRALFLNAEQP